MSAMSDDRISESSLKKTWIQHHWLTLTPLEQNKQNQKRDGKRFYWSSISFSICEAVC